MSKGKRKGELESSVTYINFASQTNVETKAKPTMFQSGKTTFSKTPKPAAVHVSAATPVMTKRQLELQKQVSSFIIELAFNPIGKLNDGVAVGAFGLQI